MRGALSHLVCIHKGVMSCSSSPSLIVTFELYLQASMGSSVVGSFFIFSFSGLSVQHFGCDPYFISDLSLKHYLISNTSQAGAYQHCII